MAERKGSIGVNTKDILPIIQKWLYSEHDIFLRELVANACDAITKRHTLGRSLNTHLPDGKIDVQVDAENKQLIISDNGLGMTEEEVEKYIAQLAFSGAQDFVKNLKDQGADKKEDIIGKFGLGFYSAFMVAKKVTVDTLSMNEGAKAVRWESEGQEEYSIGESDKTEVGTKITLHLNEDSEDFLTVYKTRASLKNHCDFLPYPIELLEINKKVEKEEDEPKPETINDTTPLWKKDPSELKDEDYKNFYRQLFPMDPEPLFWLHLNVDHPFTLQGILFFPKINPNNPIKEQNIRMYCKQVFVSDNVKNVIPDFLGLLKGTIDSNDIPLNVSRSALQGDPNITRLSNYIVKKVAESLKKLHNTDREKYESIWEDIGLFVKYGCVSEPKFDELTRKFVLFKSSDEKYYTLEEYLAKAPEAYKEKLANKVIYFDKEKSDNNLRAQLLKEGILTVETEQYIDPHFMQHAETQKQGDLEVKFTSVDAEIENLLTEESTEADDVKVKDLFQNILAPQEETEEKKEEEAAMNPFAGGGLTVETKALKGGTAPAYFKIDEQMKRFQQMTKQMGQNANQFPLKKTLVVNPRNPLVKKMLSIHESGSHEQLVEKICHHVQDLANISSEGLTMEEKDVFVSRSQSLIEELSNFVPLK